ncbi:hypothetical protein [Natranaerofaba carboxydovora]|uniref:hypothetical protein n=1 Tax=Natranaerofaba carboxydovora TaxID=2742683 RepID=UPI001F12F973|nr:hypothetical protein [Natranaerofaba carboxydovora]UMZ72989.1 sensory_box: PAS domain S-box protein [Natranaerofaba carboxydovora]
MKERVEYEETLDLPVGRLTFHTVLSPVIENNKVVKIVGSARDITEQKQLEIKLRKSEQKFRSFVENANDIIFTVDEIWNI